MALANHMYIYNTVKNGYTIVTFPNGMVKFLTYVFLDQNGQKTGQNLLPQQ